MNPVLIYMLLAASGLGSAVAGVYLLTGGGWALVAGGAALLLMAGFVRKGLTSD